MENRDIHIFTDCQGAIVSANKIELVISIKQYIQQLSNKGNKLHVHIHWVPGHNDILGNELADQQAKAGAQEMVGAIEQVGMAMDRREAIAEIKRQIAENWKLKFTLSEKMERIQETFTEVGKRDCFGEKDRSSFSALNQLLCGHTRLNSHQAEINPNQTDVCPRYNVPEKVEHYLFDYDMYKEERDELEEAVESILDREGKSIACIGIIIDIKVLEGHIEGISKEARSELVGALLNYIKCTKRFM